MQNRVLRIGHSAWPGRLLWCLVALALCSAGCTGTLMPWWVQLSWVPVFYTCYSAMQASPESWVLHFDCGLQLRADAVESALVRPVRLVTEQYGELQADSRQCWLGFWLHWRSPEGRLERRWLFQDALSPGDVRLLGRQIRQQRWQQPVNQHQLFPWFS